AAQAEPPVRVVATFSILADLVRQVGGDRVEVQALVGPEQDAHVYQPRPSEAARLGAADLVVMNGIGFEGWLARVLRAAWYAGDLVGASEGVDALGGEQHDHDHGDQAAGDHGPGRSPAAGGPDDGPPDPHAWQDPGNVQMYVRNIAAALG